jgi:hypothetical protein
MDDMDDNEQKGKRKKEDNEEEEDEEEEEDRHQIDWSRGRCDKCARRGQVGRVCRNCGHPATYNPFLGVCDECKRVGHIFLTPEECPVCEDMHSPVLPLRPQLPLDPLEAEELTEDDSECESHRAGLFNEEDEEEDEKDEGED